MAIHTSLVGKKTAVKFFFFLHHANRAVGSLTLWQNRESIPVRKMLTKGKISREPQAIKDLKCE